MRLITALGVCAVLSACATTDGAETGSTPDYSPVSGRALSANAGLVLACLDEARAAGRTDMIGDDGDSRLIRFACEGVPAQALFDAMAERSAAIESEWRNGAVVFRSTEKIQRDLYGADVCSRDSVSYGAEGATYRCQINLNVGGFIKE